MTGKRDNDAQKTSSESAASGSGGTSSRVPPISVLLADDHNILREGLRAVLEQEPDIQIVSEASDGQTAIEYTLEYEPDVVVMDISMPHLNGVEATRDIVRRCTDTKVLCLSVHDRKGMVEAVLQAGASGYLLKTTAGDELVSAIRTVSAGETYLSPPIASLVVQNNVRGTGVKERNPYTDLTPKERKVLQLIAEGYDTKDIAIQLSIADKTVLTHRQNLIEKTGMYSNVGLTRYAFRHGIANL